MSRSCLPNIASGCSRAIPFSWFSLSLGVAGRVFTFREKGEETVFA